MSLDGDLNQYTLMANVLYDFAASNGAMLSIGAGVGADYAKARTAAIAPSLVPYDGDDAWVLDEFRRAVATVEGSTVPEAGEDCAYCAYVDQAAAVRD